MQMWESGLDPFAIKDIRRVIGQTWMESED